MKMHNDPHSMDSQSIFAGLTITANGKNFSFGSERRISLSLSVSPCPISVAVIVSQNLR